MVNVQINKRLHTSYHVPMETVGQKFHAMLQAYLEKLEPKMSFYKLANLAGIQGSQFSHWKAGRCPPTDKEIKLLSQVEELDLNYETLMGWRALCEYTPEALLNAVREIRKRQKDD